MGANSENWVAKQYVGSKLANLLMILLINKILHQSYFSICNMHIYYV